MGMFDDLIPAQGAAPAAPVGMFDDLIPKQNQSVTMDVAKSVPAGVERGVIGLAGLPGTLQSGADLVARHLPRLWGGQPISPEEGERLRAGQPAASVGDVLSPQNVEKAATAVTGPIYQPQTTAGKYAETAAEFVPAALAGPGGMARNALRFGVAPGLASEAAGQATQGGPLETPARIGAALATGGVGAFLGRPNTAERLVSKAAEGMMPGHVAGAEELFQQAQEAGLPITRAEAAQAVTNGATNLGELQRQVEGYGGLKPFMAQRPAQAEALGRQTFDQMAPAPANPAVIGPQVGQAAESIVGDVNAERTAAASPLYQKAATDKVPLEQIQSIIDNIDSTIAQDTTGLSHGPLQELRRSLIAKEGTPGTAAVREPVTDPNTGKVIRYETTPAVPAEPAEFANDIGNLDRSRKYFRDKTELPAFAPDAIDKETGARIGRLTGAMDTAMEGASPSYAAGKQAYQEATKKVVEPLLSGPIGKLAKNDIATKQAVEALFPSNPGANSAGEVLDAVTRLNDKNPWAARQLVRAHLETAFNEAIQNNIPGANQWGGAKFAATIRGNPQQAANLAAAIQALHGPEVLNGFDKSLRIMEATGRRMPIGSATAFNTEFRQDLAKGSRLSQAAPIIASAGTKLPGRLEKVYERWNVGRNTEQIADLLTDPKGAEAFQQLALAPAGSAKATYAAGRIAALALEGAQKRDTKQ